MDVNKIKGKYPTFPLTAAELEQRKKKRTFKDYLALDAWKSTETRTILSLLFIIAAIVAAVATFRSFLPGIAFKWVTLALCIYSTIAFNIGLTNNGKDASMVGVTIFFAVCALVLWSVISFLLGLFGVNAWDVIGVIVMIIYMLFMLFATYGELYDMVETLSHLFWLPALISHLRIPAVILAPIAFPIYCAKINRAVDYERRFTENARKIAVLLSGSGIIAEMTEYFVHISGDKLEKMALESADVPWQIDLALTEDAAAIDRSKITFASREVENIGSKIELAAFAIALADKIIAGLRGVTEDIAKGEKYQLHYAIEYLEKKVVAHLIFAKAEEAKAPKRSIYDADIEEDTGGKAPLY